jgi:hypothetical protein
MAESSPGVIRVSVPAELAISIANRIASYAAEVPDQLRWQTPFVAQFAALPLYYG